MFRNKKTGYDETRQSDLNDFKDAKPVSIDHEKQERKRHLALANWHLLQFFVETRDSLTKNTILVDIVNARYLLKWREIEKRGILFMKQMPNGRKLAFKKWYCLKGLEDWRKCPDYKCPGMRYIEDPACPYDPPEYEYTDETQPQNPEQSE